MLAPRTPDTTAAVEAPPVPLWPSVEGFCADLAGRADGRVEELAEAMLEAICAKVPAYAGRCDAELDAVRHGLAAAHRLFLATLREVRNLTGDEVALLEAVGEQRSAQGVPLGALEEAVAVATAVGYDRMHAEAAVLAGEAPGAVDLGAVSRHLSLHATRFVHRLCDAFRTGYARAGHREVTFGERRFFEELLTGGLTDEAQVREAAQRSGLALRAPCALLVLAPVSAGRDVERRVAILRPALGGAAVGPVFPDPCPHAVALVPLGERAWEELLAGLGCAVPAAGLVVLAEYAPDLAAIARTYQVLRRRLAVAPRLGRPAVLRPMHLTPLWFANVCEADDRFLEVDRVLGAVLGRRCDWARSDLDALRALRETRGDAPAAAAVLGTTLNGLRRRLRGIEARTGLRFENPTELAMLGQALALYWADPASLPPLGDARWGRAPGVTRPYLGPPAAPET